MPLPSTCTQLQTQNSNSSFVVLHKVSDECDRAADYETQSSMYKPELEAELDS